MSNKFTLLLEHHLKELKLPTFLREYRKLAAHCAQEGTDHPDYLLRLAELELIDRHQRMVQRRMGPRKQGALPARIPAVKSLDTFDFLTIPSATALHISSQRTLREEEIAQSSGIWKHQLRRYRERHPSHGAAGPVVARIVDPSAPAQWYIETAGGKMATTATSTFSTPTQRTRWLVKSWARGLLACWSATSTPPTTTTTVPNNAAITTCAPSTPMMRGQVGRRRPLDQSLHSSPGQSPRPWNANCSPCQPFLPCNPGQSADASNVKELFPWRNPKRRRTTTPPSAAAPLGVPQDQRRHPLGAGHREQDDAGIHLRHLARPRTKSPHRLPSAARLNCYPTAPHGSP